MWPLGFQGLGHMVRILGLRFRVLRYRLRFLRGFVGFRLSGVGGGGVEEVSETWYGIALLGKGSCQGVRQNTSCFALS